MKNLIWISKREQSRDKKLKNSERVELGERQEEKNRRAKQLKQTEEIEQNAYELHMELRTGLHEKEQKLKKQKAKVKDAVEQIKNLKNQNFTRYKIKKS